jgi:hypothetical protein
MKFINYLNENKEVDKYINSIKNTHKKKYAKEYYLYLIKKGKQPTYGGQSQMAAQGIRLQLHKIMKID